MFVSVTNLYVKRRPPSNVETIVVAFVRLHGEQTGGGDGEQCCKAERKHIKAGRK